MTTLASLEAIESAGPDFICIDMCNGWLSTERVAELLSIRSSSCRKLVRLSAGATPDLAGQLLDAGADGLVIPHVASDAEARSWVRATYFPPDGVRGMGSTGRAGNWGLGARADYLATGDPHSPSRPTVAIMIEDAAALQDIDQIASVTGVDQLVVGSADLTMNYPDVQGVEQAIDVVARTCATHGLSAAIALGSADRVAEMVQRGYDTIYLSNDLTLLARAMGRALLAARGKSMEPGTSRSM